MKKFLLALILSLTSVCNARSIQTENIKQIELSNTKFHNLALEEASEVRFYVAYPGPNISGVCGLELRADSPNQVISISTLINKLVFKPYMGNLPLVKVKSDTIIDLNIDDFWGGYGLWFDVATYDGSKISDLVLKELGANTTQRELLLVTKSCN